MNDMSGEEPKPEVVSTADEHIRQRIAHTLSIYPQLSMSMLQVGIGTAFPGILWHPVLEAMIVSGEVIRETVQANNPVTGRDQTYTILRLRVEK